MKRLMVSLAILASMGLTACADMGGGYGRDRGYDRHDGGYGDHRGDGGDRHGDNGDHHDDPH